jgi:hypothetical protein
MQELEQLAQLLNKATMAGAFNLNDVSIINNDLNVLKAKLEKLDKLQTEKPK